MTNMATSQNAARTASRWSDRLTRLSSIEILAIGAILFLLLWGGAYLDQDIEHFVERRVVQSGYPVLFIVYALLAMRYVGRYIYDSLRLFRPVVQVDDVEYSRLIEEPRQHIVLAPLVLGLGVGVALNQWGGVQLGLYSRLTRLLVMLVFGVVMVRLLYWALGVGWRIWHLHRHPFVINIFDPLPLLPIARVSLAISLVFIGLMSLTLMVSMQQGLDLSRSVQRYVISLLMLLVAVGIFFMTMMQTHLKMVAAKDAELRRVRQALLDLYHQLTVAQSVEWAAQARLSDVVKAQLAFEKRIEDASEWPYSAGVIRQFGVSLLAPVGTTLFQTAMEILFRN